MSRWERGAADTSNTALAAYVHPDHSDEPGNLSPAPCSHAVPMELIHAMATMVLNLTTEEYFHAR